MIDAEHFKNINDTYGDDAGDKVLVNLASTVKQFLPEDALFARFGEEEFILICKADNEDEAKVIIEKLRAAIESLQIEHEDKNNSKYRIYNPL